MTLTVLYFASLREASGRSRESVVLEKAANVRELARRLEQGRDGLALAGALCAVNERYASPEQALRDGDTVAFFPPVSGG